MKDEELLKFLSEIKAQLEGINASLKVLAVAARHEHQEAFDPEHTAYMEQSAFEARRSRERKNAETKNINQTGPSVKRL